MTSDPVARARAGIPAPPLVADGVIVRPSPAEGWQAAGYLYPKDPDQGGLTGALADAVEFSVPMVPSYARLIVEQHETRR